ncbi:uncharacterized protein BKA55DRAFT_541584 [Fusarium redolens]|uniref:Uncharacterized protein n=1 Tax=Fusarium redolens TaxID=48865 RepID=A0A9P9GS28_FUSRE|nr:uncharacterized protein BKA55DRAFT_541584 [Fusarium redolens]KAH7243324.1 hypothetical protein BKA55DRAFT_541584 [Fusarium redolens]
MSSVDPPCLRFRMFFFFTKRIICQDPIVMRDLFDESNVIFHTGLSLSAGYIRLRLRRFFLLIKKLVCGPIDELQAYYGDYIRSRSQHPIELQNGANDSAGKIPEVLLLTTMILKVTDKVKDHILDQRPTPRPSTPNPLRDVDSRTATLVYSPAGPQGAEDRDSA